MQLRPYQSTVIDELWNWFVSNPDGHPIVEAAVGAGKSILIAAACQRAISEYPGTRTMVLVHQKELLQQNAEKLHSIWPEGDVGVYSAALNKKQAGHQVTFATIGSVRKRAKEVGHIDILFIDECHLVPMKDRGTWRAFIKELEAINPAIRVIGWTGTPFDGKGVWLTAGQDALFTAIATRITMRQLLDLEYLAPLVPARTRTRIVAEDVRTSGDDYVVSELAKITDKTELVEGACDEIVELGHDRRAWLVFCATVEHAEHVCDALRRRGIEAAVVTGDTPKTEREQLLSAYKAHEIRCLVNVAVLTTGFDAPATDFIANLRATQSPVLYVQIGGRGMRLADGKVDCLYADFTDTSLRLGPLDAIKGRAPRGGGKAPGGFRTCDSCGHRNSPSARVCASCGHAFPEPERMNHGTDATGAPLLEGQAPSHFTYKIDRVDYLMHRKQGAKDSMRVQYYCGRKHVATEWVCVEHEGFAQQKARAWWRVRDPEGRMPTSAWQAISMGQKGLIPAPVEITVSAHGEFPAIVRTVFAKEHICA